MHVCTCSGNSWAEVNGPSTGAGGAGLSTVSFTIHTVESPRPTVLYSQEVEF
jgi:hypothetical protein